MDFVNGIDLYQIIIGDVEETLANVDKLIWMLNGDRVRSIYSIDEGDRQILLDRARDVREALRRGQRMRDWLASQSEVGMRSGAVQIFNVLVSDVLKADFALHELCATPLRVPPRERLIALKGYLEAAQKRVVEFGEELARVGITVPDIFKIMVRDLDDAGKALPSHAVAERADVAYRG